MPPHWKTLRHNGIAFLSEYAPQGLTIWVREKEIRLSPLAEEMAYHLAKKKDTQYINDPIFVANFMKDFTRELPEWCKDAKFEEVDFMQFYTLVDEEKKAKELMSKEKKKLLAVERKTLREQLKMRYGHAVIDGKGAEIANWMVEPPGLFMGRGMHPLRGRWKPRIGFSDVILNLDEEAPVPSGNWHEIINDHNSMWIAKWIDKLTGKEKYVWLHDSSELQQSRNKEKYDRAIRIGKHLSIIHNRIFKAMHSNDLKTRKIATISYLIDTLGMRVGDEKDEDEADTVGATTLRVEHVRIRDRRIDFDFIGKDSVKWEKSIEAPALVIGNLQEFTSGKSQDEEIFSGINSGIVNRFLSSIVEGLTAKVFRTYHATFTVESYLRSIDVDKTDELEKIYHAKIANLQAAMFCNHKRTPPKNWEESLKKKEQKLEEYRAKGKEERVRKMILNIDLAIKTRDYNLNTSLKNYIDPRIYRSWCDYANLDWTKLYTKSLQRKFSWVTKSRKPWLTIQLTQTPAIHK
jgi:DNA topoisomerase-1